MKPKTIIMIAALFLFSGCSTTRITSSWNAMDMEPKEYNKILVPGMINDPDRTVREKMEASIVLNLKRKGYNAVCSCDEFGTKVLRKHE